MDSYCSLCTFKVPQGANNLILCTSDTIHRPFFVTRLIINKINKVQWVDFKLENVLVSLHSLKTMESFDNRFTSQVDFNYCEHKITGYMGLPIQSGAHHHLNCDFDICSLWCALDAIKT